jgi:hypothetical protein
MPYRYDDTGGTTFTTGGRIGSSGPLVTDLPYTYVTMQTQGIQLWTVPVSGTYEIIAAGAGIGHGTRGRGAIVRTVHTLTAGQRLKILVGQRPADTISGAGGTFVATDSNVPILVAGGGGGGFNIFPTQNGGTQDGVLTTSGSAAKSGAGGTNKGAGANSNESITGGAGFTTNASLTGGGRTYRASSFIEGGVGGRTVNINDFRGGFGGGGYAFSFSGAGGGGYSGGAAGESQGFPDSQSSGGGGGSYDINGLNANQATRYTTTINGQTGGFNTGDGFVRITHLRLKFYSIESIFDVTCTFPSPVEIYHYRIQSNVVKWELIDLDRPRDDQNTLNGSIYECTTRRSQPSVTLRIQRISSAQPIINTLEFYDRYMRRVMPALTATSAYYTANPITDRPCDRTATTFTSKKNQSVSVEFIYVKQPTTGVTVTSTVTIPINKVIDVTGTLFTYTGNPSYIELFDASGSPLSDTSYIGGGIRVPEWVEVEFARPIAARSYYFSTPNVDRHPTWWVIKGWDGSEWVNCSVEKKHEYDDFSEFSDALTTVNYQKYRLYIYAMKGREAADIVLFNLYDENGTEFIRLEDQIDDNRTNADTIPESIIGFRDGVTYTSRISITFRVPVRVRKVACVSLTGQWRLNDSTTTLTSNVTAVDITAQTFTLTPVTGTGATLRTPELHGSHGRLNPILDANGMSSNVYGGKSLSDGGITFQVILPGPISTYGNHYQLTTTSKATIVDFELLGYKESVTPTPLVRRSNLYARNVSISGSFSENNYDTYEVRVYEVSAVTLPQKRLEIIDFSILSNTYAPVFPIFRGQNDVDSTRELPVSIHGNYQIDLISGVTESPFSNIFDGNPESIFRTAGRFELAVRFPYPTRVSVVHVSFATSIKTWSLESDGGVTIADGIGTATVYTGRTQPFTRVTLVVESDQSVRLVDFRLLNDRGEFIPKITGSGPSTRSQLLYGGTTTESQTITFEIPEFRKVQRIEFLGQSLPSNVIVRNTTDEIIGSSDSFTGESSVTLSNPQSINKFTVEINRIRTSNNTQRFQNIRLSDILIYDFNNYIITPAEYPTASLSTPTRIEYTVLTPSRRGYIYDIADDSSLATIDTLQSRDIFGYRGRFIGAKTIEVRYDGIKNHVIRFDTPFSNVYSNVFDAPMKPLSNISFGVLSTFEGFERAGIGNLNLLGQFYEPVFFNGTRIGGRVRNENENITTGTVNLTYTFSLPKTIGTIAFETSKPAVCYIDTSRNYLPFGTYSVLGSSIDAFIGGYSVR